MSKKTRRPLTRPPAKAGGGSRAAAVGFFALLPIAVALGVVVGRSGSGDGESAALLQALRNQEAATATSTAGTGKTAAAANAKAKKAGAKGAKKSTKGGGKVVAKTKNGTVHQVTGYVPSQKKTEEDTRLVEENPAQTGENYIKAQQNLPDVIVVGGNPSETPAAPTNGSQP